MSKPSKEALEAARKALSGPPNLHTPDDDEHGKIDVVSLADHFDYFAEQAQKKKREMCAKIAMPYHHPPQGCLNLCVICKERRQIIDQIRFRGNENER